jgi:hypothetical protein
MRAERYGERLAELSQHVLASYTVVRTSSQWLRGNMHKIRPRQNWTTHVRIGYMCKVHRMHERNAQLTNMSILEYKTSKCWQIHCRFVPCRPYCLPGTLVHVLDVGLNFIWYLLVLLRNSTLYLWCKAIINMRSYAGKYISCLIINACLWDKI